MKVTLPLLALAAVMGLSLGCTSTGEKNANTSVLKEEVSEATGRTGTDWNERKDTFINQSDARINAISTDVTRMEKTKNNLAKDRRGKASGAIDDTKDLLDDVKHELGDLKKVDAEDWEEERLEFLSKLNQLEEKYTTAKSLVQ